MRCAKVNVADFAFVFSNLTLTSSDKGKYLAPRYKDSDSGAKLPAYPMATKPDIATNLAFQNLLSDNQRKYEDLRKQQKTIKSSPRTLRVNRRNKYTVVNQKSTSTKFKTGFVPVTAASLASSSSAPFSFQPSPKQVRLRRVQKRRSPSLSERTFRKSPGTTRHAYRPFSGSLSMSPRMRSTRKMGRNMRDRVQKTTEMWLPSLNMTTITQWERPFLRPLNAFEQLLNDEIVEPTSAYIQGIRQFISSKLEFSFSSRSPIIYKSTQIVELMDSDNVAPPGQSSRLIEGTSQDREGQLRVPESQSEEAPDQDTQEPESEDPEAGDQESQDLEVEQDVRSQALSEIEPETGGQKGIFLVFARVTQVRVYARSIARKIRLGTLIGRRHAEDDEVRIDDFIEPANGMAVDPSPSSDETLKALRRNRAPYILLSACSSFSFGPPIKPYPPGKHGPQMIMTPLSTLTYTNLLLSPGKEVYMTDTIDLEDLRSERMKQVLRVRFALNNASKASLHKSSELVDLSLSQRSTEVSQDGASSPVSCVLTNDSEFDAYLMPLNSGNLLHSPDSAACKYEEHVKSTDTFTEFQYQVLNSGVSLSA